MIIVGISGPSGSGKSALCRCLAKRLPNVRLLQQDWYFKDPEELDLQSNFCDPQYLYVEQFISNVKDLRLGKPITIPRMDMRTFSRTGEFDVIEPGDYLLMEGMTIFRFPEVLEACDRCIYLSPGIHAIRRRKWRRDRVERGRGKETIQAQLLWVEHEYLDDLAELPPEILVIQGAMRVSRICNIAFEYIKAPIPT